MRLKIQENLGYESKVAVWLTTKNLSRKWKWCLKNNNFGSEILIWTREWQFASKMILLTQKWHFDSKITLRLKNDNNNSKMTMITRKRKFLLKNNNSLILLGSIIKWLAQKEAFFWIFFIQQLDLSWKFEVTFCDYQINQSYE